VTNGQVLVEFFKLQPGSVHLCIEEGTQSTWLAEITAVEADWLGIGPRNMSSNRSFAN
jgi:hypothetical protein